MKRAMLTFGTGTHAEYLEIMLPSLRLYCERHGYDLLIANNLRHTRPPAWGKILGLRSALKTYDEVTFIGADCLIVDGRDDHADGIPADKWQAMVKHHTPDGEVPNTDFWMVRREMLPVLDQVWSMAFHITSSWWEQSALMELMGYNMKKRPSELGGPTELYERTHFLDNSWNVHPWDDPQPQEKRVQHATMWKDRAAIMREWAEVVV